MTDDLREFVHAECQAFADQVMSAVERAAITDLRSSVSIGVTAKGEAVFEVKCRHEDVRIAHEAADAVYTALSRKFGRGLPREHADVEPLLATAGGD